MPSRIFQRIKSGNKKTYEIPEIEPEINKERMEKKQNKATAAEQQEQKAFRMSKHKQFLKRHDAAAEQQRQRAEAEEEKSSEQRAEAEGERSSKQMQKELTQQQS